MERRQEGLVGGRKGGYRPSETWSEINPAQKKKKTDYEERLDKSGEKKNGSK